MTTDEFALYDAAYVLGALSPADRRDFEAHLAICPVCAISVSELAGLPGLISRVPIDQLTAEAEPVPETLLPSLARAVRRERRQRSLIVGTAAAAAACLIAVGGVAISRPDSPARPPVTASAPTGTANLAFTAVVPSPVTASARLVDMAWGTRIDLTCAYRSGGLYPTRAIPYAMFVVDRHGTADQVATWTSLPNRELTVMGASSQSRRDIAAVEIRTMSGRTILRLTT
ncbi:MAG: zf-HC2 domain-containing protein [Actinomycetota bacterium]